jgi:hypothetical protein
LESAAARFPTLAAPAVDGVRASSLDEPTKSNETVALARGSNLSFRLLPEFSCPNLVFRRKKVGPNLGLGLGDRDGTV